MRPSTSVICGGRSSSPRADWGRVSPEPDGRRRRRSRRRASSGEGWHEGPGTPHAEVVALRAAGTAARGATSTAPWSPAITWAGRRRARARSIEAGVARAIVAAGDPNPLVDGRGFDQPARGGHRGRGRRPGGAGPEAERGVRTPRRDGTPVRHPEDGRVARRQDGRRGRVVPLDHGRGGARGRRTACAPRRTRSWSGRAPRSPTIPRSRSATLRLPRPAAAPRRGRRVAAASPADGRVFDGSAPTLVATTDARPRAAVDGVDGRRSRGRSRSSRTGPEASRLPDLLAHLGKRDVQGVLLEGGATLAWSFVRARPDRPGRAVPGAQAGRRRRRARACSWARGSPRSIGRARAPAS